MLLSTFSNVMLLRVLECRHVFQVWDTIHKHFNVRLHAKTRQLHAELKITKNHQIYNSNLYPSGLSGGDRVSNHDLVDVVLDVFPEEYNLLVLFALVKPDSLDLTELESFLLVQEVQLDMLCQELATPSVSTNLVHTTARGAHAAAHFGRGRFGCGRGRARGPLPSDKPIFQVCNKPGHIALTYWYRYDEGYTP